MTLIIQGLKKYKTGAKMVNQLWNKGSRDKIKATIHIKKTIFGMTTSARQSLSLEKLYLETMKLNLRKI